jgi:hypothetical protein
MLHRTQQLGIDPGQPCQGLRIHPIVFLPALANQPHVASMRHDHFVSHFTQQPAYPGRMYPGFQRNATARHGSENCWQSLGCGGHFLFH